MEVSLIAAVASDRSIGDGEGLLWHFREDLRYFKRITLGHALAIGRKTYESFGGPLPNRDHYVLSRQYSNDVNNPQVKYYTNLIDLVRSAESDDHEMLFIAGGGEVYSEAFNSMDKINLSKLYITKVNKAYGGTIKFPDFDKSQWSEESRKQSKKHPLLEYTIYLRKD